MAKTALYARVSKKEQAEDGDALKRQIWQLWREAERQGINKDDCVLFCDVQSGRRDDRPEYQKMLQAIECGQVDRVILTQINRVTRSLEENARIANRMEKLGVELFEIMRGSALRWQNPQDWKYFVSAGIDSEGESRMLSARVAQTFDWLRSQGKMTGGQCPYGYHRIDGIPAPNPEQWDNAIAVIKIVLECGGTTSEAILRVRDELGINKTRQWLHSWARSPSIRGHIVRDTRTMDGNKKRKRETITIERDIFPSLLQDPRLLALDAERRLDQMFAEHKRKKGRAKQYRDYPLSGLLVCDRCGSPAHIKRISSSKYPDKIYTYIVCGQRQDSYHCGGEYGSLRGRRGTVNTSYDAADRAVIDALRARGEELIRVSSAESVAAKEMEPPEAAQLRIQIAQLQAMDNQELLGDAIATLTAELNRLLMNQNQSDQADLSELIKLVQENESWIMFADTEKKHLYYNYVAEVRCNKDLIIVKLRV